MLIINKLKDLQGGKLLTPQTYKYCIQYFNRLVSERVGSIRAKSLDVYQSKTVNGFTFSVMDPSNLMQVLEIFEETFSDPFEKEHIASLHSLFPNLFFTVIDNEQISGYSIYKIVPSITFLPFKVFWDAWLYSIAVPQAYRGKGLAKTLLVETIG